MQGVTYNRRMELSPEALAALRQGLQAGAIAGGVDSLISIPTSIEYGKAKYPDQQDEGIARALGGMALGGPVGGAVGGLAGAALAKPLHVDPTTAITVGGMLGSGAGIWGGQKALMPDELEKPMDTDKLAAAAGAALARAKLAMSEDDVTLLLGTDQMMRSAIPIASVPVGALAAPEGHSAAGGSQMLAYGAGDAAATAAALAAMRRAGVHDPVTQLVGGAAAGMFGGGLGASAYDHLTPTGRSLAKAVEAEQEPYERPRAGTYRKKKAAADMRKYEPLFAASQRAKMHPGRAAADAVDDAASWQERYLPQIYGAMPSVAGAGVGAALEHQAVQDLPQDERSENDELYGALRGGAMGAIALAPLGHAIHDVARASRNIARHEYETTGGMDAEDLRRWAAAAAQHVGPHHEAVDPGLGLGGRFGGPRVVSGDELAKRMREYAEMGDRSYVFGDPTKATVADAYDRALRGAGISGNQKGQMSDEASALYRELQKEFPDLSRKQMAGRIHPDKRQGSEAPGELLDEVYNRLVQRKGGDVDPGASTDPYVQTALKSRQEARERTLDKLKGYGVYL